MSVCLLLFECKFWFAGKKYNQSKSREHKREMRECDCKREGSLGILRILRARAALLLPAAAACCDITATLFAGGRPSHFGFIVLFTHLYTSNRQWNLPRRVLATILLGPLFTVYMSIFYIYILFFVFFLSSQFSQLLLPLPIAFFVLFALIIYQII